MYFYSVSHSIFFSCVRNIKPSGDTEQSLATMGSDLSQFCETGERVSLLENAIDAFNLEDFHVTPKQNNVVLSQSLSV